MPTLMAWGGSLGGILTGMMGFFLAWWAIAAAKHPVPVIVSGYILAGIFVGYDLGLIGDNLWSSLAILLAFACFGYWPKIEKLWKRDR